MGGGLWQGSCAVPPWLVSPLTLILPAPLALNLFFFCVCGSEPSQWGAHTPLPSAAATVCRAPGLGAWSLAWGMGGEGFQAREPSRSCKVKLSEVRRECGPSAS